MNTVRLLFMGASSTVLGAWPASKAPPLGFARDAAYAHWRDATNPECRYFRQDLPHDGWVIFKNFRDPVSGAVFTDLVDLDQGRASGPAPADRGRLSQGFGLYLWHHLARKQARPPKRLQVLHHPGRAAAKNLSALKSRGIPATVVHQRIDRNAMFGGPRRDLPGQHYFDERQIALPLHVGLTDEDLDAVVAAASAGW